MIRTRILAFRSKPPTPSETLSTDCSSIRQSEPVKSRRYVPQSVCETAEIVERTSSISSGIIGLEQSHSHNRRNGW
ncbi:hypothetical protein QVD17_00288 [Tagetes erecta]|uniref:Uncharacterized protein n=1 Tax=Tagetes erecta TaxID=13708 RepID=A0AAD8L8H5_TARER|nr:hypothetical protein QVD17_00288 [Tagetes erecta]